MNMGTHELIAILKKAAIDEGVVTAFTPGASVPVGGQIYRQLSMAKYPIGTYEWKQAVAAAAGATKAAPVTPPAGGGTAPAGGGTASPDAPDVDVEDVTISADPEPARKRRKTGQKGY